MLSRRSGCAHCRSGLRKPPGPSSTAQSSSVASTTLGLSLLEGGVGDDVLIDDGNAGSEATRRGGKARRSVPSPPYELDSKEIVEVVILQHEANTHRLSVDRELASVMVIVLGGVGVDIAKGHVVVEVRVPADREVHSSVETVLTGCYHGPLQPADHEIHETLHPGVTENAGTAERAEVIDDVERSGGGIKSGREGLGDASR